MCMCVCCGVSVRRRDRFLPDKAIDLVDEAAARLKIQVSSKPIQLDRLDRLLLQLEMERISILGDAKNRAMDEQEKLRLRAVESQIERLQAQQASKAPILLGCIDSSRGLEASLAWAEHTAG